MGQFSMEISGYAGSVLSGNQHLDECERIKASARLRQLIVFWSRPGVPDQARRANHDSGGPRLCTTAGAVR